MRNSAKWPEIAERAQIDNSLVMMKIAAVGVAKGNSCSGDLRALTRVCAGRRNSFEEQVPGERENLYADASAT
jgi:hypothetical protein